MAGYNWKEITTPANLISLSRIPIVILMMFTFEHKALFLTLLVLAMISDLLDGYVARMSRPTKLGAILDPACDKVFFVLLIIFLAIVSGLSVIHVILLLLRDIYMILMYMVLFFHKKRERLRDALKARWAGKLTTALQFIAVLWLASGFSMFEYVLTAVGVLSLAAIIDYTRVVYCILKQK